MDKFDIEAELDRLRQEMNLPEPVRDQTSNFNRKISPKTLLLALTLLILCLTASIYWFRLSQKQEVAKAYKLRKELSQASNSSSSLDINFFQAKKANLKKAIGSLEKIPNISGSLYSQSQVELHQLHRELEDTEQSLQAGKKLEVAKKLALEAAAQSRKTALPLEEWQQIQTKWQQAIEVLNSIQKNTFFFNQARLMLPIYRSNYLFANKKLALAKTSISLSKQGSNAIQQEDYTKAIINFTQAINLNPFQAELYINRGTAYFSLGRKEEAKIDFQKAIDLASQQQNKASYQIAQDLLNIEEDIYFTGYKQQCNLDTSSGSSLTWLRCNVDGNVRNKSSKNYYNVNLVFIISDKTGTQIGLINKLLLDFKANSNQHFAVQEAILLSDEEALRLKEKPTAKVVLNTIEIDVPYCTTELLNSDIRRCYNNNGTPSETYYKDTPIDSSSSSPGKCAHPDQIDSRGRRCGGRSAGSRSGGR